MAEYFARQVQQDESSGWQALWLRTARLLPQRWEWADAASAGSSPPTRIGIYTKGNQLAAGFAFLERRQRGMRALLNPAPISFSGPMLDPGSPGESFQRDIFAAAARFLPTLAQHIEIICPGGIVDVRGFIWNGWTAQPHYNYTSEITAEDSLERQAENAVRRQATRAERDRMTLEEGPELLAPLLDLWRETRRRQALGDFILDDTLRAILALRDDAGEPIARVYIVRDGDGVPQAGALLAADASRVYYCIGASRASAEDELGSGAPSFLHFRATADLYRRRGPFTYDWVGANTQRIAQFKKKFRPQLELLMRVRWRGKVGRLLLP